MRSDGGIMRAAAAVLAVLLFLLSPRVAPAQEPGGAFVELSPEGPAVKTAYGTADLTAVTLPDFAFVPTSSDVTWDWNDGRYLTSAGSIHANVPIPTGARVEFLRVELCDFNSAATVSAVLKRCAIPPATTCIDIITVSTGVPNTPGCVEYPIALGGLAFVVDNFSNRYRMEVTTSAGDATTRFRSARLLYRRQISPAPSTTTFADVPVGHALHPFVEALVAASITAGCGGGNFCPNDPITRGQMAVFLAKALGLHWPD